MTSIIKTNPTKRYRLALTLLATIIFALSIPPQITQATGETATIIIQGATAPPGFSPSLLTIHVYDSIIFVNHSSPAASYAISAGDNSFSSPAIAPNQQWKATFNSIGAHEFHAVSAAQRMIGEILVVDTTVSLLPTPLPATNATVVALIQSGHTPPDNLLMATPTIKSTLKQASQQTSPIPPHLPLFIVLSIATLLLIGLGGLLLRLRKRFAIPGRLKRSREEDEEDSEDKDIYIETTVPMRMGKEKKVEPVPTPQVRGNTPLLRLRRVHVKDDENDEDE